MAFSALNAKLPDYQIIKEFRRQV